MIRGFIQGVNANSGTIMDKIGMFVLLILAAFIAFGLAVVIIEYIAESVGSKKKLSSEYFGSVKDGYKNFEIRKDTDDIETGDILLLREIDVYGNYTGEVIVRKVIYVLRDVPDYGLKHGYCIIGFH